jgi:threonine/homoserine/homoserine lactone efflux protein
MTPAEYLVYVLGVSLAIFVVPGQVFFVSLSEGLRGLRPGLVMMLGVICGQALLLGQLSVGFALVLHDLLAVLRVAGAVVLAWPGFSAISAGLRDRVRASGVAVRGSFARGFLVTIMNPPFLIWLLTVGSTMLSVGFAEVGVAAHVFLAFGGLIASAVVMFAIIAPAYRGKSRIGTHGARILSVISGLAFLAIGATIALSLVA